MSYIPKYPNYKEVINKITSTRMNIQQKISHIKTTNKIELASAIKFLLNKDKK